MFFFCFVFKEISKVNGAEALSNNCCLSYPFLPSPSSSSISLFAVRYLSLMSPNRVFEEISQV